MNYSYGSIVELSFSRVSRPPSHPAEQCLICQDAREEGHRVKRGGGAKLFPCFRIERF